MLPRHTGLRSLGRHLEGDGNFEALPPQLWDFRSDQRLPLPEPGRLCAVSLQKRNPRCASLSHEAQGAQAKRHTRVLACMSRLGGKQRSLLHAGME